MIKLFLILLFFYFAHALEKPKLKAPQFSANIPTQYAWKPNTYVSVFIGNHVYDPNGETIQYHISDIPFGMKYDAKKQSIEGIPEEGEYSMVIFATNSLGYKAGYVIETIVGAKKPKEKNSATQAKSSTVQDNDTLDNYPTPTPLMQSENSTFVPHETPRPNKVAKATQSKQNSITSANRTSTSQRVEPPVLGQDKNSGHLPMPPSLGENLNGSTPPAQGGGGGINTPTTSIELPPSPPALKK